MKHKIFIVKNDPYWMCQPLILKHGEKLCLIFRKNHLKEGNQNTFGVYATNHSSVYTSTNAVMILWQKEPNTWDKYFIVQSLIYLLPCLLRYLLS